MSFLNTFSTQSKLRSDSLNCVIAKEDSIQIKDKQARRIRKEITKNANKTLGKKKGQVIKSVIKQTESSSLSKEVNSQINDINHKINSAGSVKNKIDQKNKIIAEKIKDLNQLSYKDSLLSEEEKEVLFDRIEEKAINELKETEQIKSLSSRSSQDPFKQIIPSEGFPLNNKSELLENPMASARQ